MNTYVSVSGATLDLIEQALRDRPTPEVTRWLDGLRHLGHLMQHTVGRLVRASPAEFPLKLDQVDLATLMERACNFHRRIASEKQLQIVLRTSGEAPYVWADRVAVAVIADNLLSNAIRVSEPEGVILVQIAPGPGGLVCSVQDHGTGLDVFDQARLFEHASTFGTPPTDLDAGAVHTLALARRFVERMGGRLWAESTPGQGMTFFFRLPYPRLEKDASKEQTR
jgi:signal transduction histidine kinase